MIESQFCQEFPLIECVPRDHITLLGAGLGDKSLQDKLSKKLETLQRMCTRLTRLPSQSAFFLLKNCYAIPKFMYLIRTSVALS